MTPTEMPAEQPSTPTPAAEQPPQTAPGQERSQRPPRDGERPQRPRREPRREKRPIEPINLDDFAAGAPRLRELDATIEDELAQAMSGFAGNELLVEPKRGKKPAVPTPEQARKKGKVLAIRGPDVFIEVPGGRSEGVLPMLQFPDRPPAIGSEVEVSIEGYDRQNGLLVLSRLGAAVVANWSTVAEGMTVEARVTESNKGGLAVEVNGIRGFMPISQIDLFRVENTEPFVNQRLLCVVTEVNPEERNLVVSRRALLEKQREELRAKFWEEVAEGQVLEGVVRSLQPFGAFVDLGGGDGLLHVSEMSWSRVKDPAEILQLGQRIKVIVLKADRETRKLSLGLKQLTPGPWDDAHLRYAPGTIIKGKVTRVQDFGAFVELEPGIEGLVHISELSVGRVRRVRDVTKEDQEVVVKILDINREQRRMSLSLKAVQAAEQAAAEAAAAAAAAEAEATAEAAEAAKPRKARPIQLRGGIGQSGGLLIPEKEPGQR